MQRPASSAGRLALFVAFLFALATPFACTAKEKKKDEDEKPAASPQPASPPSSPSDPCLRLQDEEEEEEEGTETEDVDAEQDEDAEEEDNDVSSDESCSTNPSPGSGSGGNGWDAGPGLDACEADGKAWIAVKDSGPAVCGDPLVTWCCSEEEIAKQFPGLATQIAAMFDREGTATKPAIKKDGLKLYHCSSSGNSTTFHWAKMMDDGPHYVTVFATGTPKGGTKDASCPKVTMADMGFNESAGDDDDGEDDDDVVEVGEDVPEPIGTTLPKTGKPDLQAFVTGGTYSTWARKDAAVRTLADADKHEGFKKVKVYYNSLLAASTDDFETSHTKNSVAVMELYEDDGTTKAGHALMAKGKTGAGADTWLFYSVKGTTDSAYGMGVTACVDCHKAATKDHIKSALP